VTRVWTLADAKLVRELRGHFFAVKAVAFMPDGRLVSGSEDDNARVWSLVDPDPPPTGPALKSWLTAHTNIEVRSRARH
jgi:WD40 repeat protein